MSDPLVWLIDAHVQIFRAYYSMPEMEGPDGSPVGAFRGYLATILRFLSRQQPTHVAACWDHAMTSFRNVLYADYKLGRTEAPADLEPQFALCAAATRALGIPLFELRDFEADDVIATLTRALVEQGAQVAIVTTDKDLGALVCDRVTLYDLKKEQHLGEAEIEARFGVPPERVSDWLALAGDSVDNISGVRGIGTKTAATLLNHFGSLDLIPEEFARWDGLELRGAARVHARLAEGRDDLALSRKLAQMRDDLPLAPRLADLCWRGADRASLEALLDDTGVTGLAGRVPRYR